MAVRVGMLGVSHVHAASYYRCLNASPLADCVGHWDKDRSVSTAFADLGSRSWSDRGALLAACDAIIVAGENLDQDRKSTRLNSSHIQKSRMPSSA